MSITVVSVNNVTEHLEVVVNTMIASVKDKVAVEFGGNCTSVDGIKELLEQAPTASLLFAASTFTAEEQEAIFAKARECKPDIKVFGVPPNLHVEIGPAGVIKYLQDRVSEILA